MSAPPRSPDRQNDDDLLPHSSPSHHHNKLPGDDNEAVEEKEEKKAVKSETKMEPPMISYSRPVSSSAAVEEEADEEQPLEPVAKEDSDSSPDAEEEELPEYIYIDLQVIRKEVQCPICLGIIKKTRTVMECLHRFCRECIDKSMRMGNNECPACRTHCASRRSLRDDSRYDALIASLFPDIENYEAEELALCEEEKNRNKQIQASIAQIIVRQSEALGKKRSYRKGTRVSSPSGSQRNIRETPYRRSKRKRRGKTEFESDDDEDLGNAEGQTSSYSGEQYKEFDQRRKITKRRSGSSHPFSTATSSGGLCTENKLERRSSYPGIMWNIETRTWGKNGVRSGPARKNLHVTGIMNFIGFLQNLEKKDDEHATSKTPSGADKQWPAANEPPQAQGSHKQDTIHLSSNIDDKNSLSEVVDQFRDRLHLSEDTKLLPGFEANCMSRGGQLILDVSNKMLLISGCIGSSLCKFILSPCVMLDVVVSRVRFL